MILSPHTPQEAAPTEPGNGDTAADRKKKRKRGKKKKKGSAGASAAAAGGEGQEGEGEGGAAVADADADDEDGDEEGGDEAGAGEKKKKKRKRPRKKGSGAGAGAVTGDATTAEGQAALLWERYCELLGVSPLDRDVQRFPPARFVLPSAAPAAAAAAAGKKGKDKAAVPETGITDFLKRTLPGLQKLASDKAHRVVGRPLVVIVR